MKPFDPKSTTFTNASLDYIMPRISANAWKVLCLAIRKTAGWADLSTDSGRKESDLISISQFRKGCGIASNDTVSNAIKECLDNKYLIRVPEGNSFRYYLNLDYEIPDVTETVTITNPNIVTDSVMPIVTETVTINEEIVTESVNTNSNFNTNTNPKQIETDFFPPAPLLQSKEKLKRATEDALFKSMVSPLIGYAQYPERLRPVIERMESKWHFRAPMGKKKSGQYAFWVESCDEILAACAEFGVELLDGVRADWEGYMSKHGGCAPYTVANPKSLINAVYAKAAQVRGGNMTPLWSTYQTRPEHHTMLDV